jgi:hypothetical protein
MNLEVGRLYYNDYDQCIVIVTGKIEKPDETGVDKPSSYTATVLVGDLLFGELERKLFFAPDSKFDKRLEEIITLPEARKKKVIRLIWSGTHGR